MPTVADARRLASATRVGDLPAPAFAEVAFAGRSNVGKSSLINALLGRRKLVRTSGTPGCTRGLDLFRVEVRDPDGTFDFVDLPGYGYAKRSRSERVSWGPMIEGFLTERVGLRGVVTLVDVRRGFEEEERALLEFLAHVDRPSILVATKLDKLPRSQRKPRLEALRRQMGRRVYGFSAESGEGREPLWRALLRTLDIAAAPPRGEGAPGEGASSDDPADDPPTARDADHSSTSTVR